ncbi:hypothetical protein ACFLXQ_01435 [Chloroflexota bacterium]
MATKTEHIELLTRTLADFPYDGRIHEIFTDTVNVKQVGSQRIIHSVQVPSHINPKKLKLGMPVRLGKSAGKSYVADYFPQYDDDDVNYAGKGTIIPNPPQISVTALADGWHINWLPVDGADRYMVYRNDTPDEATPDEVGLAFQPSMIVEYESPYIYFAVKSISGLNESELSAWITDAVSPPAPTSFQAISAVEGHELIISDADAAFTDSGFMCFEIEIADDDLGTNSESLGNFYPGDFPVSRSYGPGTTKYYRIKAIDWAGNESDWSDWDSATSGQSEVRDLFDGYGGSQISSLESLWWLSLEHFESADYWYTADAGSTVVDNNTAGEFAEGTQGKKMYCDPGPMFYGGFHKAVSLDLSNEARFTNDDYVVLRYKVHSAGFVDFKFLVMTTITNDWFESPAMPSTVGEHYTIIKRSEFTSSGSPDWSDIDYLTFYVPVGQTITIDDLRIVKADPDDTDTYNDTGNSWNKAAHTGSDVGEWHIYEGNRPGEPDKPFSYGQIKTAATPAVQYLSHKPLDTTNIHSGTIQSGVFLKDTDGQAGLAFFVKDVTADNWNMYAVEADSAADTIKLVKWVNGTRTEIGSTTFTFGTNEILWLGADLKSYDADGGRIKVFASLTEGNLIQASNMIMSEQDTEWSGDAGGSVGLLSYQSNVRFVNFVAGSPEHAEVADVARALDGPIVAGETKRVRYNSDDNGFEWSEDGQTWTPVGGGEMTIMDWIM